MNQVVITGNLTKDPEVRENNDKTVCKFTVAVSEGTDDNKYTNYIPVVTFNRTAVNCGKFLGKGSKVAVSGKIRTGSYTNKDGQKVYTTEVIAFNVEFLSRQNEPAQEEVQEQLPVGFHSIDAPPF